MNQEKETLEQEFSNANESREQEKVELERKEGAIRKKTTELWEVKGRLQLELKCTNQQVELYEYHLFAKRYKVDRLQVQLHAVRTNEALLHSAVDGTVSTNKSALPHLSEGVAEVLPIID